MIPATSRDRLSVELIRSRWLSVIAGPRRSNLLLGGRLNRNAHNSASLEIFLSTVGYFLWQYHGGVRTTHLGVDDVPHYPDDARILDEGRGLRGQNRGSF